MKNRHLRQPFRNFLIKKSLQFKITFQIIFTFLLVAFFTTGMLVYIYNSKSQDGSFYYMSNDIMQDLVSKSILGIVIPPIIAVELVAIIISFGIGLFSSRKIAVPLYKIEKWATRLKNGKLNTTLAFREKDRLKELTIQCNAATDFYRKAFIEIRNHTEDISGKPDDTANVTKNCTSIKEILRKIEL